MPVVTISGQYASGAVEVGRLVADLLGASYVDREVLVEIAQRAGSSPEVLATAHEERLDTLGERIADTLRRMLETQAAAGMVGDVFLESSGMPLLGRTYEEAAATAFTRTEEVSDKRYFQLLQSVMQDLAAVGDVVIVGRGGQFILRDHPGVLRARIIAPLEVRVERLVDVEGLEPREAERRLRQADQYQATFYRKFFQADVQDAMRYDIVVNSLAVPYERAAGIIADLARLFHAR